MSRVVFKQTENYTEFLIRV